MSRARGARGAAAEEAHGPRCLRCGASLPIELGKAEVRCNHCNARTPVDAALARAMREYVGDIADALRKELDARYKAAFYKQNEKASTIFIFGTLGVATFLTFAFVAWAITRQVPMGVPVVYYGILISGWGLSLAAFARGWAIIYAIPPLKELAKIGIARCHGCGAMRPFQAGEAIADCEYCKSRLVVPFSVAASLLADAKSSKAEAAADEQANLQKAIMAGDRFVGVSVFLVFALVVGAVIGVIVVGKPAGGEVPNSVVWLSFIALAVFAFWYMRRGMAIGARRRQELDAMIEPLARRAAEALEEEVPASREGNRGISGP